MLCFGLYCWYVFRFTDEVFCSAEKAKLEKDHATALKREQDEVAALKSQLADIAESHKVEMEQAASEKTRLEEEVQQLRQAAEASKKKAELAQKAAQQFQARIDAWAVEFKKVQDNMHGEFNFRDTFLFDLSELCFFSGLCSDAVSVCYAANFPESTTRAAKAVTEFRQGRKETVPASMDD